MQVLLFSVYMNVGLVLGILYSWSPRFLRAKTATAFSAS